MSTVTREPGQGDVTDLLVAWSGGNREALDQLIPLVYRELHRLAERHMRRERPGHTLGPTALVHEAYCRLVGQLRPQWRNRAQFFAVAARVMRRILVDHARRRRYAKRGGGAPTVAIEDAAGVAAERPVSLVALDDALRALDELDRRKSRVVELRVFGGLTIPETAEVLGVSTGTVIDDYKLARAWLLRQLDRTGDG